jgi:hypothetical protein
VGLCSFPEVLTGNNTPKDLHTFRTLSFESTYVLVRPEPMRADDNHLFLSPDGMPMTRN